MMDMTESDLGGIKDAVLAVNGTGVYAKLKFESGAHRVQRVPVTEASGRIHTSAATVAVLPEAEDVDIVINDKDLRIDVYRAQGAGGQHVNKTESAVRITHLPTGIAVAQQTEKSQHKNKAHAMKLLKAKLYEIERERVDTARAGARKSMVGSGDRSERIRTYNFPQRPRHRPSYQPDALQARPHPVGRRSGRDRRRARHPPTRPSVSPSWKRAIEGRFRSPARCGGTAACSRDRLRARRRTHPSGTCAGSGAQRNIFPLPRAAGERAG